MSPTYAEKALAVADDWISAKAIATAIDAKVGTVYNVLGQLTRSGHMEQRGEYGAYEFKRTDLVYTRTPMGPPTGNLNGAVTSRVQAAPASLSPGLGAVCTSRTAAPSEPVERQVLAVFDPGEPLTIAELVARLDAEPAITKQMVLTALSELVIQRRVLSRFDRAENASVYWIVDAPVEEQAEPVRPVQVCSPAHEPLRETPPVTAAPAPPSSSRALPLELPSLRLRLQQIAVDLDDAIGDACDARAPHAAIKAIAAANGAARLALLELP